MTLNKNALETVCNQWLDSQGTWSGVLTEGDVGEIISDYLAALPGVDEPLKIAYEALLFSNTLITNHAAIEQNNAAIKAIMPLLHGA